jgi:hypothetical protein
MLKDEWWEREYGKVMEGDDLAVALSSLQRSDVGRIQ